MGFPGHHNTYQRMVWMDYQISQDEDLKVQRKEGIWFYSKLEIEGLRLLLFSQGVGQGRVNSIPTGPILKLSLHHIKGQTVKSHP